MPKIRALIIDDEQLARDLIKSLLSQNDQVEIVGECEDGFDGFKKINELKPDLVILDIMMPKLTGLEMLELIENPPPVIFSTAYDEYAISAFERNAIDYLLKPYSAERFNEAIEKAIGNTLNKEPVLKREQLDELQESQGVLNRVAVRTGSKIQIIGMDQIQYLEAMDDYVQIHTSQGKFLKQKTMKFFEEHLAPDDFLRIHRSFIIKIQELDRLEPMSKDTHVAILKSGIQIPVSRTGYGRLKMKLEF